MNLSQIISIAGMPGLHKVIAQAKNGVVVESVVDKKRTTAFATHKISSLEDISMFTASEDVPLKDVFTKIYEKENGGLCIDPKQSDDKALHAYFGEVLPDYDRDRVHTSDLKKLFSWYHILHKADLLKAEEEATETDGEKKAAIPSKEKTKATAVKKDIGKQSVKTNAPKVKAQGVRKTGTA
jgi:hypothetical protein